MEIESHFAIGVEQFNVIAQAAVGISKEVGDTIVDGHDGFVFGDHVNAMVKTVGIKI